MSLFRTVCVFVIIFGYAQLSHLNAQASATDENNLWPQSATGIVRSLKNGRIVEDGVRFHLQQMERGSRVSIFLSRCLVFGLQRQQDQWWILPMSPSTPAITANAGIWILPEDPESTESGWHIEPRLGAISARKTDAGVELEMSAEDAIVSRFEARPHSDVFGHRFSLRMDHGKELENALAGFYWGTMLPLIVEKTMATSFPYSSGYILSTLRTSQYAGSYPAVDHEFQIAGRVAFGSELDLDVVRRMIELQFRLMSDDPEHLYRAPTSVQPDGRREYHIRRNSKDNHQNAAMFPLTGNIEVVEEAWNYYCATKDAAWLQAHIGDLEHAASWTLASVDPYGRVWSDVYYEDQVIKDGRETEAQAFAARSFELLSSMESRLHRQVQVQKYTGIAKKLASALVQPLPLGYWSEKDQRFIDWVDRDGKSHDHIHLLANTVPVTFSYATSSQQAAVDKLVQANADEFERFPSFVAAHVEDYSQSEMGVAGPYDLSAAGRYWYWDAAYRAKIHDNHSLAEQLNSVAAEGSKSGFFMGERYDMDHIYYVDGKNYHGAEQYFEYPNVFSAVLISLYLGLDKPGDADVSIAPRLEHYATVEFTTAAYALRYSYDEHGFTVKNLAKRKRSFAIDLSALAEAGTVYRRIEPSHGQPAGTRFTVSLAPQQEAHWEAVRQPHS